MYIVYSHDLVTFTSTHTFTSTSSHDLGHVCTWQKSSNKTKAFGKRDSYPPKRTHPKIVGVNEGSLSMISWELWNIRVLQINHVIYYINTTIYTIKHYKAIKIIKTRVFKSFEFWMPTLYVPLLFTFPMSSALDAPSRRWWERLPASWRITIHL